MAANQFLEDEVEGLGPRARLDDFRADGCKHGRKREQVRGRVVDQQHARRSRFKGSHGVLSLEHSSE